jgi:hypothetical protein
MMGLILVNLGKAVCTHRAFQCALSIGAIFMPQIMRFRKKMRFNFENKNFFFWKIKMVIQTVVLILD